MLFNKIFHNSNKNILTESSYIKLLLISVGILFTILFLLLPIISIFIEALSNGIKVYLMSIFNPDAYSSIKLTLTVVMITLPFNLLFGICAAWCVGKFDFKGKSLIVTLIDLPFSVSPVIAGFMYLLLFSSSTVIGRWFDYHNIQINFALPSIVIATIFVTFPFIVKELIPLVEELGNEEEEAAIMLGANGIKTFFKITLPNIKWGLLNGILLSSARAIGEFGAVSIVSGHIKGETDTVPLYVETLYNEYNFVAAFSISSLLAIFAVFSILLKTFFEKRKFS